MFANVQLVFFLPFFKLQIINIWNHILAIISRTLHFVLAKFVRIMYAHHQSAPFIGVQATDEYKTVQNLLDVILQDEIIDGLCKQCGSPYGTSP